MTIPIWRKIQKTNFTSIKELLDFLQVNEEQRSKIDIKPRFALNVPVRLAQKMAKNRLDDPIFRQFVPLIDEKVHSPLYVTDPVQDENFRKTGKLLHKYQGRALLLATSACAMHCRYCFRQNFPYETEIKEFENELAYIRENESLAEIILSGGDPLSLSNEVLERLFQELELIKHVRRIRFHTRFPIGIPERIDEPFLNMLAQSQKQIYFVIHTNHPAELDSHLFSHLKQIQRLGIPVLNQTVLLQGINDNEHTLVSLCETLINHGIIPYYLHLLDQVIGTAHFHVSEERGKELVAHVQKSLSGYGVPRLVREEPFFHSKTFISQ